MSKNISKLSGRKGLKDNLFKRMIDSTKKNKNGKEIKQLAEEYHVGMSTIHGAESFYEFLRPEHKEKKAWICNGSACMCAGTQDKVKKKLSEKLGEDKIGTMFCLGHCYETSAFHYNGHNYSGKDIDQIGEIIKGKKINTKNINSVSHATKSILMGKDLSTIEKFKDLISQILKKNKKETLKTVTDSNLCGRGGAGFPTGMKWDFCSKTKSEKKYVVCNADEGDSGAFSDRYLLEDQPLKVLFAMIICGYAIGGDEGVLYIRGEYPKSIEAINGCINELKDKKLLGKDILGTKFSFDNNNWLYFTKEHFDLLYPGYGDTYPIYNGAIGMTYEKAGGAAGGVSAITSDGDTLTLRSRIKHHHTTGLSTVESAYKHKDRIIKEFKYFFNKGIDNPISKYKTFVIKAGLNDPKREDLLRWLDTHGIEYGHPMDDRARSVRGYSYFLGK